jgi:hypothetical protein
MSDEILDLGFGEAMLVLAVRDESDVKSAKGSQKCEDRNEFPTIQKGVCSDFANNKHIPVRLCPWSVVPAKRHLTSGLPMQLSIFRVREIPKDHRTAGDRTRFL